MSQPRKHHYLPQFYLRGFSDDGVSIFQIEKATGKYYSCNIKDTAAIRDFHEIDGENVEDPYAIEKMLAALESELAVDLQVLLSDGVQAIEALGETVGLLSLLRMRVPAVKQHIEQSLASTIRITAEVLERAGKLPKPPPGLEEILRIDNLRISVMNWKCLDLMFGMSANPDVLNIFKGMRATLYRSQNHHFITSDQPVSLFHPSIGPSDPIGVGPALKDVAISLPLSSQALLMLDHEPGPHQELIASEAEVREFNRRSIITAQNYVFAQADPEIISEQIIPLSEKVAGFRFDNLHIGNQFYQIHRFMAVNPEETESGI